MNFIISAIILVFAFLIISLSAKYLKYWLVSPAVMMTAYFYLVMLPGVFLASTDQVVLSALLAYLLWFGGVLSALIVCVAFSRSVNVKKFASGNLSANRWALWFFVFLSVPAVVFTFAMLGRIPLFIGFGSFFGGGGDISMHAARRMNTLQHRSGDTIYFGQGYLRQIYTVVSPVFLVALFVYDRLRSKSTRDWLIFPMMIFLILASALNGQIWISINVMLIFFMAKYYVVLAAGGKVDEFSLLYRGIFGYAFLVGFVFAYRYLQFIQGREFEDFVFDTMRRIYSAGGVELFGLFPTTQDFRYGSTWLNDLRGMLPGSIQSFAYEVHYLVHGGGWGFTLSPGIVAASYVNFGFGGVFVVGFVVTLTFSVIFNRLIASESAIKIAIAIYISKLFMLAMPGDITSYVVCLVTAGIMYVSYVFLNSFLRQVLGKRDGQRASLQYSLKP